MRTERELINNDVIGQRRRERIQELEKKARLISSSSSGADTISNGTGTSVQPATPHSQEWVDGNSSMNFVGVVLPPGNLYEAQPTSSSNNSPHWANPVSTVPNIASDPAAFQSLPEFGRSSWHLFNHLQDTADVQR
jgi:hypothetical protein